MIRENTIERYTFRCPHCRTRRTRSYEARHVTDAGGHTWDYYSLNGNPAMAPTARGAVICQKCGTAMQARLVTTRRRDDTPPPSTGTGPVNATAAAHGVADGIEALITAARAPREQHFTRLGDLDAVISAIQDGLGRLPLLVHELGLTLDRAHQQLSVHGVRHDDAATAVAALYGAANTATDLAEPLVDRLDQARVALTALDGTLARTNT